MRYSVKLYSPKAMKHCIHFGRSSDLLALSHPSHSARAEQWLLSSAKALL